MANKIRTRPKTTGKEKICISVTDDGVSIYANREGLKALAAEMLWLASAPADELYHCHANQLESDKSRWDEDQKRNVFVVMSRELVTHMPLPRRPIKDNDGGWDMGFDLSFYHAPESSIDEMAEFQETGIYPPSDIPQDRDE